MSAPTDPIFLDDVEVVSSFADRTYGLLQHLLIDDESDALLWVLIAALSSAYDAQAQIAFGADGEDLSDPWRTLTDPQAAPLEHLRYATQWAGGVVPPRNAGEDDVDYLARARLEIEFSRGLKRATPRAAEIIAEQFLTGTQHFEMTFDADNPRIIYVDVIGGEISDRGDELMAALNHPDVVAAGSRFEFLPDPDPIRWNQLGSSAQWFDATVTWDNATTGV